MEPGGGRVVARRVAAGGDRGQEQQRGPQVVEEDERGSARSPSDVGQRGARPRDPAHVHPPRAWTCRRLAHAPRCELCRASRVSRRRRASLRRRAAGGEVDGPAASGTRAPSRPPGPVHGRQGGGQVPAAVLVVDARARAGPASRRSPAASSHSGAAAAMVAARASARAARRSSERTRTRPGPASTTRGTAPPTRSYSGARARGPGPGSSTSRGSSAGPSSTHWQARTASAASDTTSRRLCSQHAGQAARRPRRRTKSK